MESVETQSGPARLYPYQVEWVKDESRFKVAVKSRQIGFTFGTTCRHVRRRIEKPGTTSWISASQRQSDGAAEHAKRHAQALRVICEVEEIEFPGIDDKARVITFYPGQTNQSRMVFLPANPDTVRGYAGDVVLDEFAFHKHAKKIWKAALAIASRGYQIEVISTPNGQSGEYFEICKKAGVPMLGSSDRTHWTNGIWSVHWCDIHTAVEQGCPIDINQMREAAGDEDTWQQEYCCVFLADAENYIPMELVISCEHEDATIELPKDFHPRGDLHLGYDIARRKDGAVLWLLEEVGDVLWTRSVQTMKNTKFRAQRATVDLLMPGTRRACVDTTGMGMQMGEELHDKWGSKVEQIEFNIANKEMLATNAKRKFEDREIRIPSSPIIRSSINAVKRYTSPTGHFRFDADRTDAGHADEFWAMALSVNAASGPAVSTDFIASRAKQAHARMGAYV